MSPDVRAMAAGDLARVRALGEQLGYVLGEAELAARFDRIRSTHGLYVAVAGGDVMGWIDVHEREMLQSTPFAELGALVVDAAARRSGIGRTLVDQAIAWTRARGLPRLRLRSNINRDAAHRFYPALGFRLSKTSHLYELDV